MGSPPHTRGKADFSVEHVLESRITPAHAGKSDLQYLFLCHGQDHPRTRGEKADRPCTCALCRGSPPHTRGKAVRQSAGQAVLGITPAHAGKRKRPPGLRNSRWDHPRTRGEKKILYWCTTTAVGSPPHTRGKAEQRTTQTGTPGITPAHAGKSIGQRRNGSCTGDHPRTRGEKIQAALGKAGGRGSPPHTRGKD